MDQGNNAPIYNPGRRRYRIPGLEIPRVMGPENALGFGVSALLLAGLFFIATKGTFTIVLIPLGLVFNVLFASLFAIHAVRWKSWQFTPAYDREVRSFAAGVAPLAAIGFSVAYLVCYAMGGLVVIPFAIGILAGLIRWRELKEGIEHWFRYDNILYPGTLQHVGGPKAVRVLLFYFLCVMGLTGNALFFLPFCTVAFAVLCTYPSDGNVLSRWEATYLRVKECAMKEVREAFFVGWLFDGTPLMIPMKTDRGHWEIYGTTGSGKTNLLMTRMIESTMGMPNCSVLVMDFKADDNAVFAACHATGKPVSLMTNIRGAHTRVFHWFSQDYFKVANDAERGGMIIDGLNMRYEPVYGAQFYQENLDFLGRASQKVGTYRTPKEITPRMKAVLGEKDIPTEIRRNATHTYTAMDRLGYSPILNDTSVESFQLSSLFKTPQILHCAFANTGDSTPGDIGRIILSGITKATAMVPKGKRCQLIIFIDEFQMIAAKSLEVLFQQCRSLGILVVISCQSAGDIVSRKLKLGDVIAKNAAVRFEFSYTTGDEIKEAQATGGTTIDYVESRKATVVTKYATLTRPVPAPLGMGELGEQISKLNSETNVTYSEVVVDRLSRNLLHSISSTKKAAVVTIRMEDELNDFGGLPVCVKLDHHISVQEFEERANRPLPVGEHTILIPTERPDVPDATASVPITPPPPPAPIETVEPKKGRRKKGA